MTLAPRERGQMTMEYFIKSVQLVDNRSLNWSGGGTKRRHFFEEIISAENLFFAWQEFKVGKGRKADVLEFALHAEEELYDLRQLLANRVYHPKQYIGFYVTDPKLRHIHKACVRDRVLHHAIFRTLCPVFEAGFIHDSYACRIGKGAHRAIRRLAKFSRKVSRNYSRNVFALKCDVKKFFDTIDHDTLSGLLARKIDNQDCLWLLNRIIGSFHTESGRGIPIGNVTSQLFANVYLNELDQFVKQNMRIKRYIRYCDDFIILHHDPCYLESLVPKFELFLKGKLNLSLHPQKISIRKLHQGIDFLGYVARPNHAVLRTRTKRRMFRKLEKAQGRLKDGEIDKDRFNQSFQSYLGLLTHCRGYELERQLWKRFGSLITAEQKK